MVSIGASSLLTTILIEIAQEPLVKASRFLDWESQKLRQSTHFEVLEVSYDFHRNLTAKQPACTVPNCLYYRSCRVEVLKGDHR